MCAIYYPAPTWAIRAELGWSEPTFDYQEECYVGYRAPIRIVPPDGDEPEWREARFGLVPFWAKDTKISRQTYNARSETVASKPSYREAWKRGRFALVPMAGFFEPDYATGKAVRWRIERRDKLAFTAAAIWEFWRDPAGHGLHSFSLLTLNADGHPVMGRFHGPDDEKRSIVIVPPEHREAWLHATAKEAVDYIRPMAAEQFTAGPSPKVSSGRPVGSKQS